MPFERIRPLIGMGGDQLVPQVVPKLKDEEGKAQRNHAIASLGVVIQIFKQRRRLIHDTN